MNKLPRIFCLTLKETPARKLYAEKHFKERDLDVTFYEGIHAKNFGLRTVFPYMDDQPNWKPDDGAPYFITQGHVGCILSHYMLWKTLSYMPDDEFLILEDDVVLTENFKEKLLDYKSRLPSDWQYVFVGNCCCPGEEHRQKHAENIYTTSHPPMCTHAYMIKKESINVLIETNSVAWSHIDIQIQKRTLMTNKLKYYVMLPVLAEQISINWPTDNNFKSLTS